MMPGGLTCADRHGLRPDPILQPFVSNLGRLPITQCPIAMIVLERTRWRRSAGDSVRGDRFRVQSRGQFRCPHRLMTRHTDEGRAHLACPPPMTARTERGQA